MPFSSDGPGVFHFAPTSASYGSAVFDLTKNAKAAARVALAEVRMPWEYGHAVARLENDRDVAGGRPLTGFELDYVEELERTFARAEDHLALYGNAYFELRR